MAESVSREESRCPIPLNKKQILWNFAFLLYAIFWVRFVLFLLVCKSVLVNKSEMRKKKHTQQTLGKRTKRIVSVEGSLHHQELSLESRKTACKQFEWKKNIHTVIQTGDPKTRETHIRIVIMEYLRVYNSYVYALCIVMHRWWSIHSLDLLLCQYTERKIQRKKHTLLPFLFALNWLTVRYDATVRRNHLRHSISLSISLCLRFITVERCSQLAIRSNTLIILPHLLNYHKPEVDWIWKYYSLNSTLCFAWINATSLSEG